MAGRNLSTGHGFMIEYKPCEHCGALQPGPHMTTDCPGDHEGMQRRLALLEKAVLDLQNRVYELEKQNESERP